jgi:hypothetical protein
VLSRQISSKQASRAHARESRSRTARSRCLSDLRSSGRTPTYDAVAPPAAPQSSFPPPQSLRAQPARSRESARRHRALAPRRQRAHRRPLVPAADLVDLAGLEQPARPASSRTTTGSLNPVGDSSPAPVLANDSRVLDGDEIVRGVGLRNDDWCPPGPGKHGGQPRHGSVLISTEGLHRATVANWPGAHVDLRRSGGARQAGTDAPKTTAKTALKPRFSSQYSPSKGGAWGGTSDVRTAISASTRAACSDPVAPIVSAGP